MYVILITQQRSYLDEQLVRPIRTINRVAIIIIERIILLLLLLLLLSTATFFFFYYWKYKIVRRSWSLSDRQFSATF
jgi:hypothetical protein